MTDDTKSTPTEVPYIGPVYPITLNNYERLTPEQHELFWWASSLVADSNDALTELLIAAGIHTRISPEEMRALGL